jgi:hypothetical protein
MINPTCNDQQVVCHQPRERLQQTALMQSISWFTTSHWCSRCTDDGWLNRRIRSACCWKDSRIISVLTRPVPVMLVATKASLSQRRRFFRAARKKAWLELEKTMYKWKGKGPATMPHVEFYAIFVERRREPVFGPFLQPKSNLSHHFLFIVHISDVWHIHCHDWASREPETPSQERKRTPWWRSFLCEHDKETLVWQTHFSKGDSFLSKSHSSYMYVLTSCWMKNATRSLGLPNRKICSAYGLISSYSLWLLWWVEHVRGRAGCRPWAQHGGCLWAMGTGCEVLVVQLTCTRTALCPLAKPASVALQRPKRFLQTTLVTISKQSSNLSVSVLHSCRKWSHLKLSSNSIVKKSIRILTHHLCVNHVDQTFFKIPFKTTILGCYPVLCFKENPWLHSWSSFVVSSKSGNFGALCLTRWVERAQEWRRWAYIARQSMCVVHVGISKVSWESVWLLPLAIVEEWISWYLKS